MSDRIRVIAPEGGRVMVKQSLAAEQDVHNILKRYVTTGALPMAGSAPRYGDFVSSESYHSAWNRVTDARSSFMSLPSEVREHCNNDPGEFLKMVYDPARRDELELLGLVPGGKLENAVPEAAGSAEGGDGGSEGTVNAP